MSDMTLIDEFLNYLRFERHFSPHTAKCYAADLAQFCEFMADPAGLNAGPSGTYHPQEQGHGGSGGGGVAVAPATHTAVDARQMLLAVEPDDVRRFLAFLKDRAYC